jgi:hypothetical protein
MEEIKSIISKLLYKVNNAASQNANYAMETEDVIALKRVLEITEICDGNKHLYCTVWKKNERGCLDCSKYVGEDL